MTRTETTSRSTWVLTDEQGEIADQIDLWLEARAGKDFSTSQIARGVHADLFDVDTVLRWMVANKNGAKSNGREVNQQGRPSHLGRYSHRAPFDN